MGNGLSRSGEWPMCYLPCYWSNHVWTSYSPRCSPPAPGFSREQSAQATFTDRHKQDFLLLAPTSNYKVKQFFACDHKFQGTSFFNNSQKIKGEPFHSWGHARKSLHSTSHIKSSCPGSTSETKRWNLRLTLLPPSLNLNRYTKNVILPGPK